MKWSNRDNRSFQSRDWIYMKTSSNQSIRYLSCQRSTSVDELIFVYVCRMQLRWKNEHIWKVIFSSDWPSSQSILNLPKKIEDNLWNCSTEHRHIHTATPSCVTAEHAWICHGRSRIECNISWSVNSDALRARFKSCLFA